ncbi:MAG: ATP synthase F0 subunit B [Syntrophorhabdaceae bacterium]|nr:ATP synthase F0 subunit B [Syntrophorhabdaceae bacterium]
MNTLKASISRHRRVLPVIFSSFMFLFVATPAFAAEHGVIIPWGDVVKQIINLAIFVSVLIYLLRKPISSFLKERSEMMRKAIEDAAFAHTEAMQKLKAMDDRMALLSEEVAKLNARMESESVLEAQALRDMANAEIARINAQAEFSGRQELKKALVELRQEASELVSEAAEEIIRKSLSAQDQERLVRENIEEIERIV